VSEQVLGDRVKGTVLWFDAPKGYGFVLYNEVQHFIHYTQIRMEDYRAVDAGDLVSFVPCVGPRGPYCSDLEVVS